MTAGQTDRQAVDTTSITRRRRTWARAVRRTDRLHALGEQIRRRAPAAGSAAWPANRFGASTSTIEVPPAGQRPPVAQPTSPNGYQLVDDPRVLADPPGPREAQALEQLDGPAEQEAVLRRAIDGDLGDRLHEATAGSCDLPEGTPHSSPGDAVATVPLVDEDAGEAPSCLGRRLLLVAPVLQDELVLPPVLAPPLRVAGSSTTRAAWARPSCTSRRFDVRGSLTPRSYSGWWTMHQQPP